MKNDSFNNSVDDGFDARPSREECQWAMGCHLIALCGYVLPVASANLLGPLVLWLLKRNDGAFIDDQGKESLNFQISLFIYELVGWATLMLFVGFFIIVAVRVIGLVCVVIASINASDGKAYRYPACIRLIK